MANTPVSKKGEKHPSGSSTVKSKAATAPKETPSEWDYWVGIAVMTVLAFITRFWMINYPDGVVFDEVHFGKVRSVEMAVF
jgi:dolichyl-phosphate-mannose-protein mannosyltransferase